MAQQQAGMSVPSGVPAQDYSSSGQAGGGSGSVFGDLGGPGQQHGSGGENATFSDGPRNAYGHPTGNPSGEGGTTVAPDGVFGDLGGSGTARETSGQEIPAAPDGTDPGGQGGYR